jgi:LPXTG-site transpeptidase (sortase) family protein
MRAPLIGLAGALLLTGGVALAVIGQFPREPAPGSAVAPIATPGVTPTPSASTSASPTVRPIPDGYRVQIPRLGIDLPIAEGDIERDVVAQQTPENFAFHLPGSAIPGEGGNSYIYAHARRGMFLSLWNARAGDRVSISTPGGAALQYVVVEVHPRVPPADTTWVLPTSLERLTLQTSTGPNREDPRFVVVASPG